MRYLHTFTRITPFAAMLAVGPPSQGRVLDSGTLLVFEGPRLVGREEFVLRSGRGSGASTGFTISSTVIYPPDYPRQRMVVVVEFEPDSQPAAARFEVHGGSPRTVLYRLAPRRMTVRIATAQGESAREFPGGPAHIALDDSIFGYHALLGSHRAGSARTFSSRGDRGVDVHVADHGREPAIIEGAERTLRHLTVRSPSETRHLWFDDRGGLLKIEIPDRSLTIVREPEGDESS